MNLLLITPRINLLLLTSLCFACKVNIAQQDSPQTLISVPSRSNDKIVKSVDAFNERLAKIQPGDTILIGNGVWKDAELKFSAKGSKNQMVYILAEEKGKVFFEGESNIKMGGEFVHLEGLVFRNGYTATNSVISLRNDKNTPCNNCRLTECVIDDYNPSERFDTDYWIEVYGKNNRIDHNYLMAKRNRGVTVAVRMKNESDRENHHRIDHNYFGYRPSLGSNGGETLRIGTSHYSLSNSNTLVEDNYFERCSGELEIISSKSCQNTFRNNTFYECQGTLTMRHGNETLVENNYFIGNRQPNTGGIRIINETQTVRNNYLQGLTGTRFRAALVIMNGVPNSPINRYFQVKDSKMDNNLVIDSDHIQMCAGSDEERSAAPTNTTFANNVIYNTRRDDVFTIYDDVSGIDFQNNILSPNLAMPLYDGQYIKSGMKNVTLDLGNKVTSITLEDGTKVGPISNKPRPDASNTGVDWYTKKDYHIQFNSGKRIMVSPGENNLVDAMKTAEEGDILVLKSGDHFQTRTIKIDKAISIVSANSEALAQLTFEKSPLFSLENGGSLNLEYLEFSGAASADYSGNAVIRTSRYSMIDNYKLLVKNCNVSDLDVNHSFNFLKVYKNTFADSILLSGCDFKNITGHVLNMDKEIDVTGIYNAENVIIENCTFADIGGSAIKLYRGGRDESTFGPILKLNNTTLTNVGHDKRNKNESAIHLHGVQLAEIDNLTITDSRKIHLHLIVGEPVINLKSITMENCETMTSNSDAYSTENIRVKK